MVQRRMFVGAAAVAVVALSACSPNSGGKGSSNGAATTLINGKGFDSSAFCVNARSTKQLDQIAQNLDPNDAAAFKSSFDTSFKVARENTANVPAELKADYAVYVKWLADLQTALARHEYKIAEALADDQVQALGNDEAIRAANAKVVAYEQTTCGAGIPVTTTTSSTTGTVPTTKKK